MIRTDTGEIRFRHPLVRSALYDAAPLGQRRRVHAVLARALAGDEHADRRVWHQAMATLSGDEEVAAALEASARRAQRRAAHASAATAFERAAELTLDKSRFLPRLMSAAAAAWNAGQPDRARRLIDRALPSADKEQRAELLHLRGAIESRCASMRDAAATLIEAAEVSENPSLTLEILHLAAEAAADIGDLAKVVAFGARARKLAARRRRDEFCKLVLIGFATLFAGEHAAARETFDDALKLAGELDDDPQAQIWAANAASGGFDLGDGLPFATRAVQLTRDQGLLSLLPVALEQRDWSCCATAASTSPTPPRRRATSCHSTSGMAGAGIWRRWRASRRCGAGKRRPASTSKQVLALAARSGETFLATLAQSYARTARVDRREARRGR